MVTIDENTKEKLNGFTNSDGKIVISDDMPDDLKAAIKYLNDNNISLFSGPNPAAYEDDYEPDPFAPGYVDESSDDSSSDSYDEDDEYDEDDLDEEDDEESNESAVDDLEELF